MARFISSIEYSAAGITITPKGFETEDEVLIKSLRSHGDFNRWYFEVMSGKEMRAAAIANAKRVLANEGIAVPSISGDITDEDVADVEEQARIKKEQEEAEAAIIEQHKANRAAFTENIRKKSEAKKRGRPPKK